MGEAHEQYGNVKVGGTIGEFEIAVRAKTLEQHLDAVERVRGFAADLVLGEGQQAISAG